jgi:hypothetical protein
MPDDELDEPFDGEGEVPERPSFLASLFSSKSSGKLTDPELRERMRTLDPQERRFGFIAVPLALLATLFTLHSVTTIALYMPKHNKCSQHGAKLVNHLCEVPVLGHPSDYKLIFSLGLVLSLVLAYGALRSMRTLVIFTTLFIGLFAGIPGILFLFYGGWLVIRSWRLQRFGAKDAATARRASIERSAERREQRRVAKEGGATTGGTTRSVIQPSKRYTPKAKPRRR